MSLTSAIITGVAAAATIAHVVYATRNSRDKDPQVRIAEQFLAAQTDRKGIFLHQSESDYFANVKNYKLVLSEAEIARAVQKVADHINTNFVGERIVICGILKGAFVFCTDLCRKLTRPYSIYFVEASSYKGQVQSDDVELLSRIVPEKFKGRRVILLDELLDNGATMHHMQNHLMKVLEMPRSQIVKCVLFSKENSRRAKDLDADIVGVGDIPELWLVGYGLDDDGTKRGWTHLFAKCKSAGVPVCAEDSIFNNDAEGQTMFKHIRKKLLCQI